LSDAIGAGVGQLDEVDWLDVKLQFPEADPLHVEDGCHPLGHKIGLLDDAPRDVGRRLASRLQLEALGVCSERCYWGFEVARQLGQQLVVRIWLLGQQRCDAERQAAPLAVIHICLY
jgi:hypothetical protein